MHTHPQLSSCQLTLLECCSPSLFNGVHMAVVKWVEHAVISTKLCLIKYITYLCLSSRPINILFTHISLKSLKGKGKVSHLYSAAGSMRLTYLWNALHYLPSRATPPNLGVKIPGSHQHTHAGWGLTCLPSNAMALLVLIYT